MNKIQTYIAAAGLLASSSSVFPCEDTLHKTDKILTTPAIEVVEKENNHRTKEPIDVITNQKTSEQNENNNMSGKLLFKYLKEHPLNGVIYLHCLCRDAKPITVMDGEFYIDEKKINIDEDEFFGKVNWLIRFHGQTQGAQYDRNMFTILPESIVTSEYDEGYGNIVATTNGDISAALKQIEINKGLNNIKREELYKLNSPILQQAEQLVIKANEKYGDRVKFSINQFFRVDMIGEVGHYGNAYFSIPLYAYNEDGKLELQHIKNKLTMEYIDSIISK